MLIDPQKIKTKWYVILTSFSFSIWLTIYLVIDFLNHAPIISIVSSLSWVLTATIIGISCFKDDCDRKTIVGFNEMEDENSSLTLPESTTDRDIREKIIYLILNIFIFSLMIISIKQYNDNQIDPISNYNINFYNGGSLLLSLGLSMIYIEKIFSSKPATFQTVIFLIGTIFLLGGCGLMGLFLDHLP